MQAVLSLGSEEVSGGSVCPQLGTRRSGGPLAGQYGSTPGREEQVKGKDGPLGDRLVVECAETANSRPRTAIAATTKVAGCTGLGAEIRKWLAEALRAGDGAGPDQVEGT